MDQIGQRYSAGGVGFNHHGIGWNSSFGSFTFDVGLDFSKEDDYKKFCDSLILNEMSQKTTGVEEVK